jgi:response regulator RpfG family c-di-GMP phosphodiesterase
MTYKLLFVDDEMPNLRLLERLFRKDYYCLTAQSGAEAIKLLEQHEVAIVITDQRMPHMTGLELLKQTADLRPHMVRVLLTGYMDVEALVEALNCGLVNMYLSKPWNNEDLKRRVARAIEHYENNKKRDSLVVANERLKVRMNEMKRGCVQVLAETLRTLDQYIYDRAHRVARHASLIGEKMGLSEEALADLTSAAIVHELGNVGTNPPMLGTPSFDSGSLKFPEQGAKILSHISELRDTADIVRFYRENFDGGGYPRGLIGEQIPLGSRILRVAHGYDVMTNPRNTVEVATHEEAVLSLTHRSGGDFDPEVLHAFAQIPAAEFADQHSMIFEETITDLEFANN